MKWGFWLANSTPTDPCRLKSLPGINTCLQLETSAKARSQEASNSWVSVLAVRGASISRGLVKWVRTPFSEIKIKTIKDVWSCKPHLSTSSWTKEIFFPNQASDRQQRRASTHSLIRELGTGRRERPRQRHTSHTGACFLSDSPLYFQPWNHTVVECKMVWDQLCFTEQELKPWAHSQPKATMLPSDLSHCLLPTVLPEE